MKEGFWSDIAVNFVIVRRDNSSTRHRYINNFGVFFHASYFHDNIWSRYKPSFYSKTMYFFFYFLLSNCCNYWLQVLCFGLSLPLTEHEAIRDCVNIYCDWLTALTTPLESVPRPVIENPNLYAREIIHHLLNLFVPRDGSSK